MLFNKHMTNASLKRKRQQFSLTVICTEPSWPEMRHVADAPEWLPFIFIFSFIQLNSWGLRALLKARQGWDLNSQPSNVRSTTTTVACWNCSSVPNARRSGSRCCNAEYRDRFRLFPSSLSAPEWPQRWAVLTAMELHAKEREWSTSGLEIHIWAGDPHHHYKGLYDKYVAGHAEAFPRTDFTNCEKPHNLDVRCTAQLDHHRARVCGWSISLSNLRLVI